MTIRNPHPQQLGPSFSWKSSVNGSIRVADESTEDISDMVFFHDK